MLRKDAKGTLARQWALLNMLPPAPQRITAGELADRLASDYPITKRSVERDLQALSAVFPLECDERERPFGWSWQRDAKAFSLPGMSAIQAVVLLTARGHLRDLLPLHQWRELEPLFQQAERTLAKGLGRSATARWDARVARVDANQPLIPPRIDDQVLLAVHQALYGGQLLQVDYLARGRAQARTHVLHPLGIVLRGPITYLVARIDGRSTRSMLALHRIAAAVRLDADADSGDAAALASALPQVAAGFERHGRIALSLWVDAALGQHLGEAALAIDQELTHDAATGGFHLHADVEDTSQLRWWLMGLGPSVRVLAPTALADALRLQHLRSALQGLSPDAAAQLVAAACSDGVPG